MDRKEVLRLRLDGETYQSIADKTEVSRQRIQQILSPPAAIRKLIVARAEGRCQGCGIKVGKSGHVHHIGNTGEDYHDIDNLKLLCISCHRKAHCNLYIKAKKVVPSAKGRMVPSAKARATYFSMVSLGKE